MRSNFCVIQVARSLFETITPCLFVCFLQWELHTICPQKEYMKMAITLNLISGLWAVYCMRQVSSNFFLRFVLTTQYGTGIELVRLSLIVEKPYEKLTLFCARHVLFEQEQQRDCAIQHSTYIKLM